MKSTIRPGRTGEHGDQAPPSIRANRLDTDIHLPPHELPYERLMLVGVAVVNIGIMRMAVRQRPMPV